MRKQRACSAAAAGSPVPACDLRPERLTDPDPLPARPLDADRPLRLRSGCDSCPTGS
ncbi:MAG: hypothetical protein MZV64_59825 [Ignavibacteriales bacterium]|nr:hypothetical protein [Ignavibacteriales bacterium]